MKKTTANAKTVDSLKADDLITNAKHFSFFQNVWQVVRLIPQGRVSTYGAIARYLGTGSSARMVGWAMSGSLGIKPKVPAHRVVNRNGMLTGKIHFTPPEKMQAMLEKEGIIVANDTVYEFKVVFWDPVVELL